MAFALLGAEGFSAFGQSLALEREQRGPISAVSLVSTALIRPLIFDPDLLKKRPVLLRPRNSQIRTQAMPVYFVSLAPALKSGRMKSQHKSMTLKIRRQVSSTQWIEPADPFEDATVIRQVDGGKSQPKL